MTLNEEFAYVKGMIEGLSLEEGKKESKAIHSIVELLGDMVESIAQLEESVDDINDQVDDINDNVSKMGIEDDDYDDDYEYDDEDDSDPFYEVECPKCGTKVFLPEDKLSSDNITCPNCNEKIDVKIDECDCEDCDCEDCDCGSSSDESDEDDDGIIHIED